MAHIRGEGFNKEKFVCLTAVLCLCLLAMLLTMARHYPTQLIVDGYAMLFGSAPPERLGEDAPVTSLAGPSAYQQQAIPPLPSLAGLGDRIRKTPFAPTQYQLDRTARAPKPEPQVVVAPPPLPAPTPKAPTAPQRPASQKDKDLEVAYMGVMEVQGETYGLLRAKDGSYRRVKVGDKMPDFNYTITRIEKLAIFVQTEEGRVYMLKNDRFTDVAGSGGEGAANKDSVPSFTEPRKEAPAPKTQNRPQGLPQLPQGMPKGMPKGGNRPTRPQARSQG